MSERKVLNKYYPPDFDPSKIPRMKLPKNRQYTVRLMAPFNMRCATCGEYIYKGKKFNARKEDVENEDYLGIRIYRFYIKCTRCLQEISFKTDPKNTDYEIEAGATRNFMALKLAEEQALREEEEAKEEEANNPMKLLENRTKQSKNEIELLESLEELKDLNRRQRSVDFDSMLMAYDTKMTEQEREKKLQELDEEYIKSVKFQNTQKRKVVVEEEIIEEVNEEPVAKIEKRNAFAVPNEKNIKSRKTLTGIIKINSERLPSKSETSVQLQTASNANQCETLTSEDKHKGSASKRTLSGIVKINKEQLSAKSKPSVPLSVENSVNNSNTVTSGLLLLGTYSDSDNSEDD